MMAQFATRELRAQMLATATIGVLNAVLLLFLARLLGPENYAVYGVAAAVGSIALVFQDGGHKTQLFRELTHPTDPLSSPDNLISAATGWTLLATGIVLLGGLIYGLTVNQASAMAACLAVTTNLNKAYCAYASSAMRARNAFVKEAGAQLRRHGIVAVCVISAALMLPNPFVALTAALTGQAIALWLFSDRRELRWPRLSGPILQLMLIDLLTIGYSRIDLFVLASVWPSKAEVGVYTALSRVIDIYVFALTPLAAIFFRMVRVKPDSVGLKRFTLLSLALGIPGLIALPVAIYFGEWILVTVLGPGYRPAAEYLPWLVVVTLLLAPNYLAGQLLISRNRERTFVVAVLVTLAIKATLCFTLIPRYGPMGCVMSIITVELVLMCILMTSVARAMPAQPALP